MHILRRGSLAQRLRIASGLVLFAFATTHFRNHTLGLVDLKAMHEVEAWRKLVTPSVPGSIVLSAALVTHMALPSSSSLDARPCACRHGSSSRSPWALVPFWCCPTSSTRASPVSSSAWGTTSDKFLGDGLLAVSASATELRPVAGRLCGPHAPSTWRSIDSGNAKLGAEIGKPLRVGMGIHAGPMLIGRIGYGETVDLTVVGNAVNVTSRLIRDQRGRIGPDPARAKDRAKQSCGGFWSCGARGP